MAKIPPAETPIIDRGTGRISLEWYAALQRLVSEIASFSSGGVATFEGRSGTVTSQSGDYTASEITNSAAGNISATDVQSAINELDTEKISSSRQVISGAGLTGGGDLSADRTFAVGAGTGITVNADSVQTDDSAIVHDNLSGFVANEHVDHSSVTLTAGSGLTGGGDITANRSFAVGAGTGIAVNADDVALSHLGIQDLTDPGADRLVFWDDSETKTDWLTLGTNLSISGTTINAASGSGGSFALAVQAFTASDTYTPTANMAYCEIEVQAPGGGGGGADANGAEIAGAGGGGGEYAKGVFSAATIGGSQSVTIGAVGAAGSNDGGTGGTGGTTSVGALITAIGGSGGTGTGSSSASTAIRVGGAGGTGGTGGHLRIPGQRGGWTPTEVETDTNLYPGSGGSSHLGLGAVPSNLGLDQAGVAGGNYGGGGSGGRENDTTGSAGGAGGPAIVVITEYIFS